MNRLSKLLHRTHKWIRIHQTRANCETAEHKTHVNVIRIKKTDVSQGSHGVPGLCGKHLESMIKVQRVLSSGSWW
jgi:hypothetical protein